MDHTEASVINSLCHNQFDVLCQVSSLGHINLIKNSVHVCVETAKTREHLESRLECGIPNMDIMDDEVADERGRSSRIKRVVGGIPSKPVSCVVTTIIIIMSYITQQIQFSCQRTEDVGRALVSVIPLNTPFLFPDSDPVANRSGGQQEDRLWRSLYRRVLGSHCSSLRQVGNDETHYSSLFLCQSKTSAEVDKQPTRAT